MAKGGPDPRLTPKAMFIILLALAAGTLIGMMGTGSGVLLTPLLIVTTPYPALTIIGTDVVLGTVTRLVGVFEHHRLQQVRWRLAGILIAGSVPATFVGGWLIHMLKTRLAVSELEHILKFILAMALFGVSFLLPFVRNPRQNQARAALEPRTPRETAKLVAIGALVGLLVSLTSIGSGSLMMIFLLLLMPARIGELVGTDIFFGVVTGLFAGSLHLWMGHFDPGLFLRLLAGALPGVILGSRLTARIPERVFSWLFSLLYFALGARLLFG